jgi:lipopolysaccharide export system permease protein
LGSTLDRYLLRQFLARAAAVIGGLTAILLLFDLLANADDIVEGSGRILLPLLVYAALRLPEVVALVVPLAALLATLGVYATAVSTHEMVAIRAAGISIYRATVALIVGAALLAGALVWFSDTVLPATSSRLELWQARDYDGLPPRRRPQQAPSWFSVGDALVEVRGSSLDGRELTGVTVIRRNSEGRMVAYLKAARARYDGELWVLEEVTRAPVDGRPAPGSETLRLALPVTPQRFAALGERPGSLSFAEIWRLASNPDLGGRPAHVYWTWFQRKLAHPAGALVMVLLAAPIGLQHGRRNRAMMVSIAAIGAGFLFFVAERLLLALGETGLLPPTMAVWAPAVVFSMLASWILLHYEG